MTKKYEGNGNQTDTNKRQPRKFDRPRFSVTGFTTPAKRNLLENGKPVIKGVVVDEGRNETRYTTRIQFNRDRKVNVAHVWPDIMHRFENLGYKVPAIDHFRLNSNDTGYAGDDGWWSQIVVGTNGKAIAPNREIKVWRKNRRGLASYKGCFSMVVVKVDAEDQELRMWKIKLDRTNEDAPEVDIVQEFYRVDLPAEFQDVLDMVDPTLPELDELAEAVKSHLDMRVKEAVDYYGKMARTDRRRVKGAEMARNRMVATRTAMQDFTMAFAVAFANLFLEDKLSMQDFRGDGKIPVLNPVEDEQPEQEQTAPESTVPQTPTVTEPAADQTEAPTQNAKVVPFPEPENTESEDVGQEEEQEKVMVGSGGCTLVFATEGEIPAQEELGTAPAPTTNLGSLIEAAKKLQESGKDED